MCTSAAFSHSRRLSCPAFFISTASSGSTHTSLARWGHPACSRPLSAHDSLPVKQVRCLDHATFRTNAACLHSNGQAYRAHAAWHGRQRCRLHRHHSRQAEAIVRHARETLDLANTEVDDIQRLPLSKLLSFEAAPLTMLLLGKRYMHILYGVQHLWTACGARCTTCAAPEEKSASMILIRFHTFPSRHSVSKIMP